MKRPKRRRLMMIAPHFEEYSWRLARAIALHGETEVVLATDLARLRRDFTGRDFQATAHLQLSNGCCRSPVDLLHLLRLFARFRPTVIHLQEPSGFRKAMVCAALVAIARPFCRIVLTVHDPQPHEGRDHAIAARLRRFRNFIRGAADVVFVHGAFCRDEYASLHSPSGQTLVAVDHGEILADSAVAAAPDRAFSMLCFGRMEAYKGLDVLADALALLARDGSLPDTLIVGTGPALDALAPALTRFGPHVRVANTFIASRALIDELRAHDCVVMPYLAATQSGVLAAALANGCFVIASRVGGLVDIVEDGVNGLLVPPGDPEALAKAIAQVSRDADLRRSLASGARRTAEQRLDWAEIAAKTVQHYRAADTKAY